MHHLLRFSPMHGARLVVWLGLALPTLALSMDLKSAFEHAQQQDATIRMARHAATAQREKLPQAQGQWLPNIAFNASHNRNDLDRTQGGSSLQESYPSRNQTLSLRQPLFRKPLFNLLEQSRFAVQDADAALEREEQNLAVRVTAAFLEALLAQDQLNLIEVQTVATQTQLVAARKSFAAGSATRTDIDEAQARLDLLQAQALEARQNIETAHHQLRNLTQQDLGNLPSLQGNQLPLTGLDPADLDGWLALAESNSPELAALKARREMARLEIEKAQGAHYPTLDLLAQITHSSSENVLTPQSSYTNRMLGLQLNLPLYAGGVHQSVTRQAAAEYAKSEEALEAGRRDLAVRVRGEYQGVTEGVLKIKAFQQAVHSAEVRVTSNRKSYQGGSRTMVDVLNAEEQLQTARRDLARTQYLYLMSWVKLHALAGQAEQHLITTVNRAFEPR